MAERPTTPGTLSYFWMQEYDRVVAEREVLRAWILALDAHKCGEAYTTVNDMQVRIAAGDTV